MTGWRRWQLWTIPIVAVVASAILVLTDTLGRLPVPEACFSDLRGRKPAYQDRLRRFYIVHDSLANVGGRLVRDAQRCRSFRWSSISNSSIGAQVDTPDDLTVLVSSDFRYTPQGGGKVVWSHDDPNDSVVMVQDCRLRWWQKAQMAVQSLFGTPSNPNMNP